MKDVTAGQSISILLNEHEGKKRAILYVSKDDGRLGDRFVGMCLLDAVNTIVFNKAISGFYLQSSGQEALLIDLMR
ncbi:MAG: hypothetical protein QM776_13590 [Rhodocyclaceae bacterium]